MQIPVFDRPRLGRIKVGVATDAVSREVGVSKESALSVEGTGVAMETLAEEDHDVCKLLHLVPNVVVGDFPEAERSDTLPHLEGIPDGLVGLVLAHLRGVILYTDKRERGRVKTGHRGVINFSFPFTFGPPSLEDMLA